MTSMDCTLRDAANVVGGTADIGDEILPILAEDICLFASGGKPLHIVNGEYLKEIKTESKTGEE